MTIGIIGGGRFGSLAYSTLKQKTNLKIKMYSQQDSVDNLRFFSLKDTSSCEVVIPCVPTSEFENLINEIKGYIKPHSLILDVCSVKIRPTEILLKVLPSNIDILSTHPLFGPDSSKNGTMFAGLRLVFWKTRINNLTRCNKVLKFLKDLGLELIEMTPEEHDRQAAYTQAFAQLIGRIGSDIGVKKSNISTKGFEGILYNQLALENDTKQLFKDIQESNPFTLEMRRRFADSLANIQQELCHKNPVHKGLANIRRLLYSSTKLFEQLKIFNII